MIPKGKLLALLLVFTAVGGVAATGAFTTVQAERTADVTATGDGDALLQITAAPNTEFAANSTDAETSITANDVNLDAETLDDDVLRITNNGNDPVTIDIQVQSGSSADVAFYVQEDEVSVPGGNSATTLTDDFNDVPSSSAGDRYVIDSQSDGVTIGTGDQVSVGLFLSVDDAASNSADLFDTDSSDGEPVTITADATSDATSTLNASTGAE